jgi:hypothetical protein
MNQEPEWTPEFDEAFEQGIQEGMKRERALWELAKTSQEIEQPRPLSEDWLLSILLGIDPHTSRLPKGLKEFARAIEAAHGIKEQS